jgi:aspartate racemase
MRDAIGILGGMGPRATHYFVGELLTAIERAMSPKRDQDYPDMRIEYACSNPDRSEALVDGDAAHLRRLLLQQLQQLRDRGCTTLLIPCLSAHAVLDPIPADLPLIDVRRATFDYLAAPARESKTVALLGTRATNASIRHGTSRVVPPMHVHVLEGEAEDRLMSLIYHDLKRGSGRESTVDMLIAFCERFRQSGATHVIAGCTEIEMCLAATHRCPPYVVFPLRLAAQQLVRQHVMALV